MQHYAKMGIPDYFLYDAEACYLPTPMMGFRLMDNEYVEIPPNADGGVHSTVLGLDFYAQTAGIGIYDKAADTWIQAPVEAAKARAEAATERAEQETAARQELETELARLREELSRLKEGN